MRAKKTPPPKPINGQPETQNHLEETIHSPHRKTAVRRRGQARKPYQERLLNMAEARREIVMALKLHRASMKQKNHPGPEHRPVPHPSCAEQEEAILKSSRRNPRIYASTCYVNNVNAYSPGLYLPPYYSRPVSSSAPPLFIQQNPNFVLPSQALGLKLNLQNFNNLDASFYSSVNSSSNSRSPEVTYMAGSQAVDDRRKSGWGDDLNLGVSGGRAEFLDPMGFGPDQELVTEDLGVRSPFDEVMEFPAWLNAADDESCVGDVCGGGDYYFRDPALPCMDIEEIEGMDEEWLA